MEKVGFVKAIFFYFCKFTSCNPAKKLVWSDFPEKRAPTKEEYLLPVC